MCKSCDWESYIDDIDNALDDEDYEFAEDSLSGIKSWVEENEHITPAQKQAIDNIISSRG